ncbi:hypothetical protein FB470_001223 [Amycolatopsis thermophila]|uniref:Uncharacterized protein n=1 Tax=Amycolatopsis thermophila TaxID=206084 RepID=A0ABU0EPY7_9PSEU|nr:hypothetical protein [Amycolatopsis thermophila]
MTRSMAGMPWVANTAVARRRKSAQVAAVSSGWISA